MKNSITLLLCAFCFFANAQTVHTVDNRDQSGAQFTDLQAAINASVSGDIIQVHPSMTSYGNVTIDKTLTIFGLGHNPENSNGDVAMLAVVTFIDDSGNSELKGLVIGTVTCGNSANNTNLSNIHIINNRFTSQILGSETEGLSNDWIIEGNYLSSSSNGLIQPRTSHSWQIRNNVLTGGLFGLHNTVIVTNNIFITTLPVFNFFGQCNNPLVNNNIFLATHIDLTEIGITNSTVTFENNITYNYTGTAILELSGSGNLNNQNPLFENVLNDNPIDFYNNNYDLAPGSPGINEGSDGTDIGLYGNNFIFDNNGRPNLTPYPESIEITNSVVLPGQTLNVNFSAIQKQ